MIPLACVGDGAGAIVSSMKCGECVRGRVGDHVHACALLMCFEPRSRRL